jgi:hypothetical protein
MNGIADFSETTVGNSLNPKSTIQQKSIWTSQLSSLNYDLIMSLRTSLRTTQVAYRGFSTYLPRWQEAQPQAGPSTPAPALSSSSPTPPTTGGFSALKNIFGNAEASSSTSIHDMTSSNTVSLASVKGGNGEVRGYSPAALPPKVDTVMDLFTNMIMKDGLKGQAQQKMVNILRHL